MLSLYTFYFVLHHISRFHELMHEVDGLFKGPLKKQVRRILCLIYWVVLAQILYFLASLTTTVKEFRWRALSRNHSIVSIRNLPFICSRIAGYVFNQLIMFLSAGLLLYLCTFLAYQFHRLAKEFENLGVYNEEMLTKYFKKYEKLARVVNQVNGIYANTIFIFVGVFILTSIFNGYAAIKEASHPKFDVEEFVDVIARTAVDNLFGLIAFLVSPPYLYEKVRTYSRFQCSLLNML